jgi:NAD(P)-dependent dehydrogenase (short-subunit alcohol dehydrogenase family)
MAGIKTAGLKALITGASEGIGLAIAQRLLKNGHHVWGTSRNPRFAFKHENFHPVVMDLRYEASIEQAFALAQSHAKGFDILINNAGAAFYAPAKDIDQEAIKETMQVLFFGPLKLSQLAWNDLAKNNGKLIQITSLATLLPIPYHAAYNAAKSALSAYTRTMQIEAEEKRIAVVEVLPGDINTQFHHHACAATATPKPSISSNEESRRWQTMERVKQIIEKRLMQAPKPEKVARAVARICEMNNPPEQIYIGSFFQAGLARRAVCCFSARKIHQWIRKYYGISHGLAFFLL